MSQPEIQDDLFPRLQVMRILFLSMVLGPVLLLLLGFFLPAPDRPQQGEIPLITLVGIVIGGINLMAHLIVPALLVSKKRNELLSGPAGGNPPGGEVSHPREQEAWYSLYQVRLIIAQALLEGAALLLGIAFLIERTRIALAGALVLLACMARLFPTAEGVQRWVNQQSQG